MPVLNLKKTYQKYPEYKDSGIEWLKKIPSGWNLLPVRAVLKERNEKNSKLEIDNILSVMKGVGVIRYADKGDVGNKSSDRPEAYKIVRSGDIVLNSMNLSIGSVGIAREEGVTSSVYIIYGPRPAVSNTDFYHYLFETTQFQRHLASYGKGIMELREAVREINIRNQEVIAPSLDTQKIISDFLDKKIKLIDQIIEKKQRLISLLQEKRSAIITHAVTKGLDPKAKMKPSGVDWIDFTVESWQKIPLKYLFIAQFGGMWGDDQNGDKNDIICVRVADFDFNNFVAKSANFTLRNIPKIEKHFILNEYSILLEKSGGGDQQPVGRAVRYLLKDKAVCSNFIQKLQVNKKQNPNYITLLLSALYIFGVSNKAIKKTTGIQNLDLGYFLRNTIFLPNKENQELIVKYIEDKSKGITEAINTIKSQIEVIKEYRSSLIYHAVTGKIKI